MAKLSFGGGAGEIGGPNFYVLESDGTAIAVDCGLGFRQTDKGEIQALPDFGAIAGKNLAALLVTHGHLDHLGSIPCLKGHHADLDSHFGIYMSLATRDFAHIQWKDTLKLNKMLTAPPFSDNDMSWAFSRTKLVSTGKKFSVGSIDITAFNVAHILGALGYLVEIKAKRGRKRIFFTGDYSLSNYPYIKEFQKSVFKHVPIDVLVTEGTYAGRDLPSYKDELERFKNDINDLCMNERRTVLIPVFSIDRAQKLYWILDELCGLGDYIHVDGAARKTSVIYNKHTQGFLSGIEQKFVPGGINGDIQRTCIIWERPAIILASAGMLMQGSIAHWYASLLLERDDAAILLAGFQGEQSPGFKLLEASKAGVGTKFSFGGYERELKAVVKRYWHTAHAREEDLAEVISKLKPRKVIFTHCEKDGVNAFIGKYPGLPGQKIIPANGDVLDI